MKRSRSRSPREEWERRTLRKLRGAGATPGTLLIVRANLQQWRKLTTDTLEEATAKADREQLTMKCLFSFLAGDEPPEFIIVPNTPTPAPTFAG
jgi:hypothetical protein